MLKKVLIYILVALFILAALPLLIVFGVPILAFWGIYAWVTLWAFRRREAGRVYLVCTARRNWHDLLVNHIIPALPEGSRVVWRKASRGGDYWKLRRIVDRAWLDVRPLPYLLVVTRRKLRGRSLNESLQPFKDHPAKTDETRRACEAIIVTTVAELRGEWPETSKGPSSD